MSKKSKIDFDNLTEHELYELEWKAWQVKSFPVELREQFKEHCKRSDYTVPMMLVKMIRKELSRKKLKRNFKR